jgi:hypothetical protein
MARAKRSVLVSHADSVRHKRNVRKIKQSGRVNVMLEQSASTSGCRKLIEATLRQVLTCVVHNISFSSIDHIVETNKVSFSDSKLAKDMCLKRTKGSMIAKNVLAAQAKEKIRNEIKDNHISVLIDESTDVGNKRLLRILIKYVYNFKIKTQLLDLEAIGADEGTARGLYNLLKACFLDFKINTQQIIGFCSDNASVMVGVKESVKAHLLSENPALIGNRELATRPGLSFAFCSL